jgi:ankyrin repeat protein
MADAMELSKQVYNICDNRNNPSTELRVFLESHPEVCVNQYRGFLGKQALHIALRRGHAACVRMLLQQGADVHAREEHGVTAMINACASMNIQARVECMQLMIDAKADVNAATQNDMGSAPIHYLCNGRPQELELLLENKANVNALECGANTPAMLASICGKVPCLQVLIDSKADLNWRDEEDQDALQHRRQERQDR